MWGGLQELGEEVEETGSVEKEKIKQTGNTNIVERFFVSPSTSN